MPRCRAAWQTHLAPSRTFSRPGLRCVFCGINPGRVSAAAAAHFANPRNDFWRLLHDGGFTPRLLDPQEQFDLLELGYGVTNAAYRTTPGSGDLRRGDFDFARLEQIGIGPGAARDRVRRQGGVSRALQRAPRARPAGADDRRRRRALRAPVDLAGERGRPVRRAAALVPGAAGLARRRPRAADRPGVRRRRRRPAAPRALPKPAGRHLVGRAGRRDRGGGDGRAGDPARAPARRSGSRSTIRASPCGRGTRRSRGAAASSTARAVLPRPGRRARAAADGRRSPRRTSIEVAWWTPEELAAPRERLAPLDLHRVLRTLTA